ncbi:MAG: ATP-binding cassette domain-containing protein, partial [Spirochaetaceae bacterium]|nr:ATP-binding cassette domain-containing protein [Spirochaetaceae bacterium]
EILGIAGVEGNGQRELVEALTGLGKYASGDISITGADIKKLSIRGIRDLGTSHIPEDRMTYGCASELSIEMNLLAYKHDHPDYNKKNFMMDMNAIKDISKKLVDEYRILCSSPQQEVGRLSGGNIQKVVVAREFSSDPKLIIADQPTRGIDVGATEFIRKRLVTLRDEGSAVLLVSADLNEVMELSDSLIVMYAGKIAAYIEDASSISEEKLGLYMLGLESQDSQEIGRVCHD